MKVLHVSAGALYGGVERVLVELWRGRHHCPEMEPQFAVCFAGRLSKELPAHMLGEVRVSRPWSIVRARRRLRELVERERFEVVICHLPWAHAIFAPAVKTPCVFWMHGFATGRHWTERWASRTRPALVICNSRATAETVARLFPGCPAEVCYSPIEPRYAGGNAYSTVILQASRMEPWKGHLLHLEALAQIEGPWECWIAGGAQRPSEQRYLDTLQQRARSLGIADRVRFLGQRTDIPELMAQAGIFCQPNTGPEPFGLVFVEALAASLPVLTTNLGAAPEIIDESCGVLVPPGDAAALAQALARLVRDAQLRAQLGAAGPARARLLCDPERQIQALYAILKRSVRSP